MTGKSKIRKEYGRERRELNHTVKKRQKYRDGDKGLSSRLAMPQ